jgi:pimeloyl-ACP methyl ester carboxylesterase
MDAARARGIRLLSYGRPSYGGSTARPGRDIASAAADVAAVADAFGVDRFAVMGSSGGGPRALACAALLAGRVGAAVTLGGVAPLTDEFDWFGGMVDPGGPRAAIVGGRGGRAQHAETGQFNPACFTEADWAALAGGWAALGADVGQANDAGSDGLIDDDVAIVTQWGFELAHVGAPVLLVQGGEDRVIPPAHADWMLSKIPGAELWLRPRDGHISILDASAVAMDWLAAWQSGGARAPA